MLLDLRPDGSLRDVRQALADLVETANAQLPFAYRIDRNGDTFSLVATRTRDEQGRAIDLTPILDHHISIPLGTRRFYEHINLLTHALEDKQNSHCLLFAGAESQPGHSSRFGLTTNRREALSSTGQSRHLATGSSEPNRDPTTSSQVTRAATTG
jgi:hypothetical protein